FSRDWSSDVCSSDLGFHLTLKEQAARVWSEFRSLRFLTNKKINQPTRTVEQHTSIISGPYGSDCLRRIESQHTFNKVARLIVNVGIRPAYSLHQRLDAEFLTRRQNQ